jgi:ATP-dependent DNA helicase RecG
MKEHFFEGLPADYIAGTKTPKRYRNPFLAQAMAELNMIDTMGYGIHEMHLGQARRFFPMPDYDLSEAQTVKMTIHGRVVDPAYSRLLIQKTDLPLTDILALDRVQKRLVLDPVMAKHLRKVGLIEGRKPNWYVSAAVAKATSSKADYIRTRGMDDAYYKQQILDLITKFGSASRLDIDKLLLDKLSDALDDQQKQTKVGNLLTSLRRGGKIQNSGPRKAPVWILAE